jgi:predicted RecA/RadA family phage recombinase
MAKYIQVGDAIDFTPVFAPVVAGDIVEIGNILGVAKHGITQTKLGSVATVGVYELDNAEITQTANSVTAGDEINLVAAAHTHVETDGILFGYAVADGANGKVRAMLVQVSRESGS